MATTLALAPVPRLDAGTEVERPRTTFDLPIIRTYRGKDVPALIRLTAFAEIDGSSMLSVAGGGAESTRALRAMLFRVLVDDDGVGYDANVALLSSDRIVDPDAPPLPEGGGDDGDPADERDPDPPQSVPSDAVLAKRSRTALLNMAWATGAVREDDESALTKNDLINILSRYRDAEPEDDAGTELATADEPLEGVVSDAAWRIVWPHDDDQDDDDPYDLADTETFTGPDVANRYCEANGSSRRRFASLLVDPLRTVTQDGLTAAINHIAEAATGRPTQRPRPSSGSRSTRRR